MSRCDRRFARFYYDDFLRDYPEVYRDDAAFATWLRLLVVAECSWPLAPELPRSARPRSLRLLEDAGLIVMGPRHTFAVKGHDAERTRRHGAAIAGANASTNARAIAQANAEPRREQDETRRDSPPPQVGRRTNGTNPRALGTNPRALGTSPRQEREAQKRGPTRIHEILSSIQTKGPA